jgi:putative transposase
VVERTFAWLGYYRRLSKDYEHTPTSSTAVVQIAAIHHYLRRLDPVAVSVSQRFRFEGHRPKQAA